MYKIKVPINPVPASRPRVTRWSTFYSKKYTSFRTELDKWKDNNNMDSYIPLKSILRCVIELNIEMPKSYSIKKKKSLDGNYCANNSDLDNYAKAILDGFNEVLYNDDKQIVELIITKKWSYEGNFVLKVEEVEPFEEIQKGK